MKSRKLGFEIHTVDLLLKRNADSSEEIRRNAALTGTHGYILGYLAANRDRAVYQRDIERAFSIRRSSASQVLQLMERNGLIERRSVDSDARLKQICMTEKGNQIHEETISAFRFIDNKALMGIDPEEVQVFYRVMDGIKRNLNDKQEG